MENHNSELYERIKYIRKVLKWTQEDLGKVADVSRVAVSLWEQKDPKKRSAPDVTKLQAISDATGFSMKWLTDNKSKLEAPEGVAPVAPSDKYKRLKENPIVSRLHEEAATIANLSDDGGSDDMLISTLQMLSTYRRVLQKTKK